MEEGTVLESGMLETAETGAQGHEHPGPADSDLVSNSSVGILPDHFLCFPSYLWKMMKIVCEMAIGGFAGCITRPHKITGSGLANSCCDQHYQVGMEP